MKDINENQQERKLVKPKRIMTFHVDTEDLQAATLAEREQLSQMRDATTYWKDVRRRFKKNKVSMVALFVLILVVLFAFVGPMISPFKFDQQIRGSERLYPNIVHWLGTDNLGRDMLVRIMIGTRISLIIGIVASLIETVIGTIYGSVAGYVGGRVDNFMMRLAEIIYSIPDLLIVILLSITLKPGIDQLLNVPLFKPMAQLGSGLISIFITFSLLYWVGMARMVRSQILVLKQMEYVSVAKALGAKGSYIVRKHMLPNSTSTILVTAMFQIPAAIFTESFLSFLGLGVSAPLASLGSLTNDALKGIQTFPHLLIAPAIMISLIILTLNLFGDGLRDALDPRMRD